MLSWSHLVSVNFFNCCGAKKLNANKMKNAHVTLTHVSGVVYDHVIGSIFFNVIQFMKPF